ncbi:hypothetical protein [Jannaschia marina]|uniref:hypothetical protein n=1 Tax=Jannaschia marina TaxID=2741674 RepID=UPI0015C832DF|nr:hypothetical protein [Jannaschia marina]
MSTIRPVRAHVKAKEVSWGLVHPYPEDDGNTYKVPMYEMEVSGTGAGGNAISQSFEVIRFGVKRASANDAPSVVGLKDKQSHTLKRVGYMGGSWQLYGNFLIHDGANDPQSSTWGQIGCIEVTGKTGGTDNWAVFEALLLRISGARNAADLGASKQFTIDLDAVVQRPPLLKHP